LANRVPREHKQCERSTRLIDEADRLKTVSLAAIMPTAPASGLILIGMPGVERRLARFPQLHRPGCPTLAGGVATGVPRQ
jgi:hypothetical protein